MSELISTVSNMLRERKLSADRRREAAERMYSQLLAAQAFAPGDPRVLLDAMDVLQLEGEDLWHDHRVVNAARVLERQLAETEKSLREAHKQVAIVGGVLHEAQGTGHRATIDRAHVGVGEAEAVVCDLEYYDRALRQQINANAASAPRVFAGRSRLLAVPGTPADSNSADKKSPARVEKVGA